MHARAVAQLHGLLRQGVHAGDHGLGGDDRGHGRQGHHGVEHDLRHQRVEGVEGLLRVAEEQRALAEVVEEQRGQHHDVPRQADGPGAEVAHVCVEGLAAGDAQHHRAQHHHAVHVVDGNEAVGVDGIHGGQDVRAVEDGGHPQRGDDREPGDHQRAEDLADALGAVLLHPEQDDQDQAGAGQDEGPGLVRGHVQALHGREHGDGRGDDAVAVQQRCAEDGQGDEHCVAAPALVLCAALDQGQKREDAALALVVGAHDEHDVLEADHHQKRPDDEREHAQDVSGQQRHGVLAVEAFAHGVQRAGADVAVDHAERRQGQGQVAAGVRFAVAASTTMSAMSAGILRAGLGRGLGVGLGAGLGREFLRRIVLGRIALGVCAFRLRKVLGCCPGCGQQPERQPEAGRAHGVQPGGNGVPGPHGGRGNGGHEWTSEKCACGGLPREPKVFPFDACEVS